MKRGLVPCATAPAPNPPTDMPFLRSLLQFSEPVTPDARAFQAVDVAPTAPRSAAIQAHGWEISELQLEILPGAPRWIETADLVLAFGNAQIEEADEATVLSLIDFSRLALRPGGFLITQLRQDGPLTSEQFITLCRHRGFPAAWRASPLFPADPFLGEHVGPSDLVIARQDMPCQLPLTSTMTDGRVQSEGLDPPT